MRRVLVLNNYPMDRVMQEVELGETPDHLLFGVNRLMDYGYEPVFLPYPAMGRWAQFQRFLKRFPLPLELGDLQQQILAKRLLPGADLIYAPCGSQTHWLQYIRATGRFPIPIVTLMHHPFPEGKLDVFRGWQRKLFLRGADRLPSLSGAVASDLRKAGCMETKLAPLVWGADVGFYGPWEPPPKGSGVIANGRTGRDFLTFALAVAKAGGPATLIGLQGKLDDPIYHQTGGLQTIEACNEEPIPGEDRGWLKYPALCEHMRAHEAIAIPLFAQRSLAGLTSLMDALGLGRAVLMTRNRHIDLDIEAEEIGFWLEPGDVDGWADRIRWVVDHPVEVAGMGARARKLAETTFNSATFAKQIVAILDAAICQSPRPLITGN